jgi:Protein of unknown function (DUF3175)
MEATRLKELAGLMTEKKWSGDVKTKWTPPKDLFTKGASEIVKGLLAAPGGHSKAMSRLNFYINRAGKNLSDEDKARLEKAKNELKKKNEEYFTAVDAFARRAGLIVERKKPEDEEPDMDMDGDEEPKGEEPKAKGEPKSEPKGGGEDEDTLPKIVKRIAKKAVGKDVEELEDLIMKVYDAGHKDGEKAAKSSDTNKTGKRTDEEALSEKHHVKHKGKITKKGTKAECDKHAEENGGEVFSGDPDKMAEAALSEKHHVKHKGKVVKKGTKAECDAHAEKHGGEVAPGDGEPVDEELEFEPLTSGSLEEDWTTIKNSLARVRTDRVHQPCMTPAGKGTIEVETATIPGGLTDPKAGPFDHVVTVKLNSGKKGSFPAGDIKLFKGKKPDGSMFGTSARTGGQGIVNADKGIKAKATQQQEPGTKPKGTGSFLDKA